MSANSPSGVRKRCLVVYATRERQHVWNVELGPGATIADALAAARRAAEGGPVAIEAEVWDLAPVGVFGEPRGRDESCGEGDRIELYRPLQVDPRTRRRARVQQRRRAGKGG
jgi:putative ubiquitin-RnfH superfamily antitoxin RatB of RatAB toxin-antitoxin module